MTEHSTIAAVAGTTASVAGSALWAAGSAAGSLISTGVTRVAASYTTAPPNASEGTLRGLGSADLLQLANTLSGIFSSMDGVEGVEGAAGADAAQPTLRQPEVPRLVVVGTQSSGKSSVLNGLMAADILPLGDQMVTRVPLSLQLVHDPDETKMRAEFGDVADGGWRVQASPYLENGPFLPYAEPRFCHIARFNSPKMEKKTSNLPP